MSCVGAMADRAESVHGCRELAGRIAVRTAAGPRVLQLEAEFAADTLCHLPKLPVARRRFH